MQNVMPPIDTPDNAFHDGNDAAGVLGTIVSAKWLNDNQSATRDIQEECHTILKANGFSPDPSQKNQLWLAIQKAIGDQVPSGSTSQAGKVQLSSAVNSESELMAATSKAAKIAMDNANARLAKGRNLSDLDNPALALQNLGLSPIVAQAEGAMQKAMNGKDIENIPEFIKSLGLDETMNPSKRVCIGGLGSGVFNGKNASINVGDSGFVNSEPGRVSLYSGNNLIGYFDVSGMHLLTSLFIGDSSVALNADLNGQCWGGNLSTWLSNQFSARDANINSKATVDYVNQQLAVRDSNINARATYDYVNQTFVRRLRRGAVAVGSNEAEAPAGCFVTMTIRTNAWYRPLQMNINGTWYNVDG